MRHSRSASRCALAAVIGLCLTLASAQEPTTAPVSHEEITGNVVSVSFNTLVVRTNNSQYHVFVFENYTQKPKLIATGSVVRVTSIPSHEPGVRVAERIVVEQAAPEVAKGQAESATPDLVPREVRALENDLKRQVSRFGAGFRMGTSLDSELFLFGVQARIGPIVHRDLWFRPNLEIGFGEVTNMVGINLEFAYRVPVSARGSKWSTYFGAGPGLNFTNQNFERQDGESSVEWGDFEYKTGFNIFMGMQHRKGPFFEVKTSIYSEPAPVLRLVGGYTF
jgi:hypothetical protein